MLGFNLFFRVVLIGIKGRVLDAIFEKSIYNLKGFKTKNKN